MISSRRDVIRWGLLGLGGVSIGCFDGALELANHSGQAFAKIDPPNSLVSEPWTRMVGLVVLESWSTEDKIKGFRRLLADAPDGGPAFAQHIRAQHQNDLAQSRVRRVDGWLLSDTEATFYAYVADGDDSPIVVPKTEPKSATKKKARSGKKAKKKAMPKQKVKVPKARIRKIAPSKKASSKSAK